MRKGTRLGMEALEAREVPASLSFTLADGATGSGQFTMPDWVPGQANQWAEVGDLVVQFDGQTLTADDLEAPATAALVNGAFAGLTANFYLPESDNYVTLTLESVVVSADGFMGPLVYDTADTQATFELSDGTAGSLSYDIPWDAVDPDLAAQSVSLTNFVLNIAGQNLTPTTATFTTSPTAQFAHGVVTGITFAIDTSALANFPYTAVWMSGLQASGQQPMIPPIQPELPPINPNPVAGGVNVRASMYLDFSGVTTGQAYRVELEIKDSAGARLFSGPINIGAGLTAKEIRDLIASAIGDSGLTVDKSGDHKILIASKGDKKLGAIDYRTYIGVPLAPALLGPTNGGNAGGATLTVNGIPRP